MCSPGINGEGELRGNRLTQVNLEKWPCECVCVGVKVRNISRIKVTWQLYVQN